MASYYASLDYLTACERLLFSSYIKRGSSVFDLGVGGGRTTRYLAFRASRYVGADYAESMIKACEARFPDLEFAVANAADLSRFPDACFDAVVIAFNGIDYVFPAESRHACFRHLQRVIKPAGFLIFSSHNPRAVLVRQSWNRERLWDVAQKLSAGSRSLRNVLWAGLTCVRVAMAVGQSACRTAIRILTRVPSRAFWRGEGSLVDSAHGGLLTHCWTPQRAIAGISEFGFRVERVLGDDYAHSSHEYMTDWYYYVFAKR